jgi:hypothetical protein
MNVLTITKEIIHRVRGGGIKGYEMNNRLVTERIVMKRKGLSLNF